MKNSDFKDFYHIKQIEFSIERKYLMQLISNHTCQTLLPN